MPLDPDRPSRCRWTLLAALATLPLAAGACSTKAHTVAEISNDHATGYSGTLLVPAVPRPDLTLADINGGTFALAHRPAAELTVLFFGYTHCPDVCPTTMADLAAAKRKLSSEVRARVRIVFVTEDPRRDTQPVLRGWLDRFDPSFTGLIGGGGSTSYILNQLHLPATAFTSPTPTSTRPGTPGMYAVSHSGIVYVFAQDATLVYTGGTGPSQYAQDLTRLAGRRAG